MPLRYCKLCDGDVEDVGGYCLLGHPLRLDAPIPSVAEMRDEISRALGEANLESILAPTSEPLTEEPLGQPDPFNGDSDYRPVPPPPPEIRPTVWESLEIDAPATADPITAFAPPPRMDWGPERSGLKARNPLRRRSRPAPA
jgi:hypothetical protein